MAKVVIAGGFDTSNLGDYASFAGLVNILQVNGGGEEHEFVHLSRHPSDTFRKEFPFVRNVRNLDWKSSEEAAGKMFRGFNSGDGSNQLSVISREIAAADVLMIGNGRLFVDYSLGRGRGPLAYFSLLAALADTVGIPYVIWSMTLVEPTTSRGRYLIEKLVRGANRLLLRDVASAEIAVRYGASGDRVKVVPDFAWALGENHHVLPEANRSGEQGPSSGRTRIAVNFRGVSGSKKLEVEQQSRFISKIAGAVDIFGVSQQHYQDPGGKNADDDQMNLEVFRSLGIKPVGIRGRLATLAEICQAYDEADVLVTTRRHGLIIAATRGLPTILWASEENTSRVLEGYPVQGIYGAEPRPLELIDLQRARRKRHEVLEYSRSESERLFLSVTVEDLLGQS